MCGRDGVGRGRGGGKEGGGAPSARRTSAYLRRKGTRPLSCVLSVAHRNALCQRQLSAVGRPRAGSETCAETPSRALEGAFLLTRTDETCAETPEDAEYRALEGAESALPVAYGQTAWPGRPNTRRVVPDDLAGLIGVSSHGEGRLGD